MAVDDIAIGGVLAMLAVLVAVEIIAPARSLEPIRGWWLKCLAFVPVVIGLTAVVPILFAGALAHHGLLPGHRLGLAGGAVVGIVVSELVVYWAHRLHHRVPFLWRWIHQLHHSAERVDVFGAAYFHPFEILEGAIVGMALLNLGLGLSLEAAVLVAVWQAFNGMFQHANIRTPSWLGYIIQRPEQHGLHHERGVHGSNYANLMLWDLVFGTFKNPRTWNGLAGFYPGSSKQTLRMLLGRDVSQPPPATARHDHSPPATIRTA